MVEVQIHAAGVGRPRRPIVWALVRHRADRVSSHGRRRQSQKSSGDRSKKERKSMVMHD